MKQIELSSTVSTDDLARDLLRIDPEVLASLASNDIEASNRLGGRAPIELDGLEVLMRRVLVAVLAMRANRPTCVRLLTERQAKENGWPDAHTANLAQLFAWAMLVVHCRADMAFPPLVEADDAVTEPCAGQTVAPLPSLEALIAQLWPSKITSKTQRDDDQGRAAWANGAASTADALKVAAAHTLVRDWLGIESDPFTALHPEAFDPADPRTPTQAVRFSLAWIFEEALETFLAMQREQVFFVRLKTDQDAELARHPGATESNLALLLAASLYHASGVTLLVLAPHPHFAEGLVEASEALGHLLQDRPARMTGAECAMLEDLSAREYVHVGRSNSRAVAWRLYDEARKLAEDAKDAA